MAVAVVVPDDIIEQILLRSNVKTLIRFKNVCKSWQSLISGDRFIKAHLNQSYNNDRKNNKIGHRRIGLSRDNLGHNVKRFYIPHERNLVGSSNGLVCISPSHGQLIVTNPLTRDMKTLPNPKKFDRYDQWFAFWGFGYDSSTDDYKVIAGIRSCSGSTSFQVLSLKTNVWKDVGTLKYMRSNLYAASIFCNGRLHWFMKNQNGKDVILSFDLFEEKFEEISGPREFKFNPYFNQLGIIEECLCICDIHRPIWVMKSYSVRESWISLQDALQNKNDVVHYLRPIEDSLSHTSFFANDDLIISTAWDVNCVPVFVRSVLSPNAC